MVRAKLVSVLVPCFNEEANVTRAHAAIRDVFGTLPDYDYEIIFTDNHSTDGTFDLLASIALKDPRVRVIRFARNEGYQRSVLAAYQAARGDCAIQLDCDLQDPPSLIPQMLELWREGHEVVYGIRRSLPDGPLLSTVRRGFYRLANAMSEDDLPVDAGEFRLVDARLLAELRRVQDATPYVRGLVSSMGFSQVGFEYDRQARIAGTSKFPLTKMMALALDGILNHSLVPLRIASLVGMLVGLTTVVLIVGYLVGRMLFGQNWPAGFATTTVLLLLGITLNGLFLGIIGEYLGRIFLQLKARARPIVQVEIDNRGAQPKADEPVTGPVPTRVEDKESAF
ncbi:glycosyltransferase [Sphingomonas arenae]|uniref:glycosyltransferase n=1 Tax=Sphingomonas arenae TaxID=2812555 RepID=UPI0019680A9B|nr:glycosyltransferase [Sphingomonas arenae]